MNMLYREFGCDAVLCKAGTFNIHGHATLHSACRACTTIEENEPDMVNVLGRTFCDGVDSAREILRMIYVDTLGRFWGKSFQPWADMKFDECELYGVSCVNGKISRLDLTGAEMCSNGDRQPGVTQYCKGIPAEIGKLSTLEVLQLSRRHFLRGSIPTEIGMLSHLRFLDMSGCASITGTLPSEIGNMEKLNRLILSHSRFRGTIPSEIFRLGLEKLYLTNNLFEGTISTWVGKLTNLKEFMISRNNFTGSLPTEIGGMTKLDNFEAYSNGFVGSLPTQLALPNLKRLGKSCPLFLQCKLRSANTRTVGFTDIFGNKLTGSIPDELARVEVSEHSDLSAAREGRMHDVETQLMIYFHCFDRCFRSYT
jgi:hypothetical protein